ncbi:hypothetical protein [Luteibacter sp. UNCMF366Tsu5.1]|uniref:hypothetical protein n=1 Tax=Luteibacter sp. UNCMF366Tsu5.1 TaxID=1502758 RepID=UPI00090893F0|nr:hypothetical protein [Luteibacter sp. UNCMF366Tsu5.1]SFW63846.1 hypothetical protein SAMN02800691_2768 [Luteibacter sp. UNCMF366Tsu5.1]
MKTLVLALLFGLSLTASATPPPGTHREPAPAPDPMQHFSWRDDAAGYTFVAPPRWAGKVRAIPLASADLSASGALSGVRFVAGNRTLLVLLTSDETRAKALTATGATELSRHDGHVVAFKAASQTGSLALTAAELAAAVQWDGGAAGSVAR